MLLRASVEIENRLNTEKFLLYVHIKLYIYDTWKTLKLIAHKSPIPNKSQNIKISYGK